MFIFRSCRLGKEIVSALKGDKIDQKICVMCPNGLSLVVAQWATWMTGNIFVPLSSKISKRFFLVLSKSTYYVCKVKIYVNSFLFHF